MRKFFEENILKPTNEMCEDAGIEPISNCCGAKIYHGDLCAECQEHCEPVEIEEEQEDDDDYMAYRDREVRSLNS